MERYGPDPAARRRPRAPVPVLIALALLLPVGPVALLLTGRDEGGATRSPLSEIARDAGCRLTEFRDNMKTNPPVRGRFVERISARDGSYADRRPPSLTATIHALYHGRVLLQYRPDLPNEQIRALDRFTRQDADKVLLFENQTGMAAPVAATAYQSVMTCARADRRSLQALDAFRARRRSFGQAF